MLLCCFSGNEFYMWDMVQKFEIFFILFLAVLQNHDMHLIYFATAAARKL